MKTFMASRWLDATLPINVQVGRITRAFAFNGVTLAAEGCTESPDYGRNAERGMMAKGEEKVV